MKDALARAATVGGSVSGHDRTTLNALFAHPITHNVAWTDVVKLVGHLGRVDERTNDEFVFQIGEEKHDVHKAHTKHLTAPEVIQLRQFIDRAGCSPEAPSQAPHHPAPASPSLIVVVDHHEARVFHIDLDSEDASRHAVRPYDAHHLLHNAAHKDRSSDHRESATADRGYFEAIAHAVAKGGRIVVVGHGKGESSAAHHLAVYLRTHHPGVYSRIVDEVVADLPHLTQAQLLDIGRDSLRPTSV